MTDETKAPGLTVAIVGTGASAVQLAAGLGGHLGPLPRSNPDADPVDTPPTLVGPHGRAWRVDQEALWALNPGGRRDGQVANWVVEAPWAHPIWHSYWVALVHLRPFPGLVGGTRIYLQGATHELWVYALSPDEPRGPFIAAKGQPAFMTPVNFSAQLREPGDAVADGRVEAAVAEILAGTLNPDTDAVGQWAQRFGDNMLKGGSGGGGRFVPNVVQ